MANRQQGNLIFIDTTANDILTGQVKIYHAIYRPSAANGYVILLTASGGNEIIRFSTATDEDTKHFDFSRKPLVMSQGISSTVSNAELTLVFEKVGGAN